MSESDGSVTQPESVGDVMDGFVQIYETDFKLIMKENDEKMILNVVFKILVRLENDLLEAVRLQIVDQVHLGFLYETTYDIERFKATKTEQEWHVQFLEFPNVIRKLITAIVRQDEQIAADTRYKAVFSDRENENETEDVNHDMRYFAIYEQLEFLKVKIFSLAFTKTKGQRVLAVSQARYDEVSAELGEIEIVYKDACRRVERQVPGILDDFNP